MNNLDNKLISQRRTEEYRRIKKLFHQLRSKIHWIILSVCLSLIIALLINLFKTPIYRVSSKIMIVNNDNKQLSGSLTNTEKDLTQGITLNSGKENFDNQSVILKSYGQLYTTLRELKFEITYCKEERFLSFDLPFLKNKQFISTELYQCSPFLVVYDTSHVQPINMKFFLQILKNGKLKITAQNKKSSLYNYSDNEISDEKVPVFISREITPGEILKSDAYAFTIILRNQFQPRTECQYSFTFNSLDALTLSYQKKLSVLPVRKFASLLEISIPTSNPKKGKDFLNKLMTVYQKSNLEKKNEIASRTINFIESQLSKISDSLKVTENTKQAFQSNRKVMDLSFQGEEIYKSVTDAEKSKAMIQAQQKYFIYLKNYLETHSEIESIIAPSAMGIEDQLLNKLILEINRLSLERSTLSSSLKMKNHPMIIKLDVQIRDAKAALIENTKGLLKNSQIALDAINNRLVSFEEQVRNLPKTQQQYVNIERKYTLNNEIYNYMMQRRAEAQISMSSNTPDNEIIESANYLPDSPIFPKKNLNYMIAMVFGLLFPILLLQLKKLFGAKIQMKDDISQITDKPIIGHIFHLNDEMPDMLLLKTPNSPTIEPFWSIRTQLDFFAGNKDCPVVVITSSCPGEGKTFCSINIASAYALSGKKTLLVGFDLRNPKIHRSFKFQNSFGLSSCLQGEITTEEAIQKTEHENLYLLPSGPIPSNPSQLVTNVRTQDLINHLKSSFDRIVLDTAPMGLVSDAYFLSTLADATIIVVRQSYSFREQLRTCLAEAEIKKIHNIGILINDVTLKSSPYDYNYNYSYKYKYPYAKEFSKDK